MQVEINTIEKEVVSVVKEEQVILTLSLQEASDLMTLCGNIGGKHPEYECYKNHIRRTTDNLYKRLDDLDTLEYNPKIMRGAILTDA